MGICARDRWWVYEWPSWDVDLSVWLNRHVSTRSRNWGRRSLKFVDYGIMAATFLNLETNISFRVISTEEARDLATVYAPEIVEKYPQQLEAYKRMPDSVLFRVQKVRVDISKYDLPGPTRKKVSCSQCGQVVRDNREVVNNSHNLCKPCAQGAYFSEAEEVTWRNMNWAPAQKEQQTAVDNEAKVQAFYHLRLPAKNK